MASVPHSPVQCPDDWVNIAVRELKNLKAAYKGEVSNDAKIDFALMATEAALKAIIWKLHEHKIEWKTWPNRSGKYKFLYSHRYESFLKVTDLEEKLKLNNELWASWQALVNAARKQYRYSPERVSDVEANAVARSARHPDEGVVPWFLNEYRKMT